MTPYYDDGQCVIYLGDCREVLPTIDQVDALITDPPYGVEYQSNHPNRHHGNPTIFGDDAPAEIQTLLRLALGRLRFNRHFYIFGVDCSDLTVGGISELIWDKGDGKGMGDLSLPWKCSHERITFGVWSPYRSQEGTGALTARLRRGSVLSVSPDNSGQGARLHPTAKPVLLLRQLIESSTVIGETVLDPFMGSGSTLLAARIESRRAVGIEIEERYCEVAANRLAQGVLDFGATA